LRAGPWKADRSAVAHFLSPSTTMRSPGFRPSLITQSLPKRGPDISVLGKAGCYTLKVGRVTRPPFPLPIHLVPYNLTILVVKGRDYFAPGRLRSGFRRGRYGTRRGRSARRRKRSRWLRGHPSQQSPVSDRRNRESELHRAIESFSTSQNHHLIIS